MPYLLGLGLSQRPYELVPKEPQQNVHWRLTIVKAAQKDRGMQKALKEMSCRSLLFWVNTFLWLYEPRPGKQWGGMARFPWLTWPVQDKAFRLIRECLGKEDLAILKSRDMSGTFMVLAAMLHAWIFQEMQSFLLMSRKQELVDAPDRPGSLFWKLRFLKANLPSWMQPETADTFARLTNLENRSVFGGDTTTPESGVGERHTSLLLDEFQLFPDGGYATDALTADIANSRFFVGTPGTTADCHYTICTPPSQTRLLTLSWRDHPERSKGMYTSDAKGRLQKLDKSYKFPAKYKFILDGKMRSPAYDAREGRIHSAHAMAQQWDLQFIGVGANFFDEEKLAKALSVARPPDRVGDLIFDEKGMPTGFDEAANGRLSLWFQGQPPPVSNVLGIDVAAGTGASNSAISVGDADSGAKLAEFVSPHHGPVELAVVAVALARWFGVTDDPIMIWEALGHGLTFGKQVHKLGWSRVYHRAKSPSANVESPSDIAGWVSTEGGRIALLSEYRRALGAGDYQNLSVRALTECRQYVYAPSGGIVHMASLRSEDPSGARANHGDIVIADALCWKQMVAWGPKAEDIQAPIIPENSVMGRYLAQQRELEPVW